MQNILVMGASGRMGATLTALVRKNPALKLAGVVEKKERQEGLEQLGCPVAASLEELFAQKVNGTIIDFTAPLFSVANAKLAAQNACAIVIGTTGFDAAQKKELAAYAKKTPIFWSPNMSVGINVLLQVLPQLTRLLGTGYDLEISEVHHRLKKDAPSGTAIRLGECVAQARGQKYEDVARCCREGIIGERTDTEIGVQTLRGGDVVGDHTVFYFGAGERIEVTHRAHSRETFAQGALRAAAWLAGQPAGKIYAMEDMLQ